MCYCFPSQDINNLPHAAFWSPAELLKTTSYQMNPQFRLSKFKFKFIAEASLMWEDTSLWRHRASASITIKRNRRCSLQEVVGKLSTSFESNPVTRNRGVTEMICFLFLPFVYLLASGLNNEDALGFHLQCASTRGSTFPITQLTY